MSFAVAKLEFDVVLEHIRMHVHSEVGRETLHDFSKSISFGEALLRQKQIGELREALLLSQVPHRTECFQLSRITSASRISGSALTIRDIIELYRSLSAAEDAADFLRSDPTRFEASRKLLERYTSQKILLSHVGRIIDIANENIRDDASKELARIRDELRSHHLLTERLIDRILSRSVEKGYINGNYVTLRDGRMVLPVLAEHKHHVKGIIHGESATGTTIYIEPFEVVEANNTTALLVAEESHEILRLLTELTEEVSGNVGGITSNISFYGMFDGLVGCATYANTLGAEMPSLVEKGKLHLYDARHPLLAERKGKAAIVPLEFQGVTSVTLISGPNAGGKTVALKTIGLVVFMANRGLPVSASEGSVIPFYNNVEVIVGDEQSIEEDLSTFSSHVKELEKVSREAGDDTLILIDEICSGTDAREGGALAAAFLERLVTTGATTIATAHNAFLKMYVQHHPAMRNVAMQFDEKLLQPTYRMQEGLVGKSYALELAANCGVEAGVVRRAHELLAGESSRVEELLNEATHEHFRAQEEREQAEKERIIAGERAHQYEELLSNAKREARELIEEAKAQAMALVKDTNKKIEEVTAEVRRLQEAPSSAKETLPSLREKIRSLRVNLSPEEEPRQSATEQFQVGQKVKVKNIATQGVVEEMMGEKMLKVSFGDKFIVVHHEDVSSVGGQHVTKEPKKREPVSISSVESLTLDIRGLRSHDAIHEIEQYVDRAFSGGLHQVQILHGKGTGALRQLVKETLLRHPHVSSLSHPEWNAGGDGITIVTFKIEKNQG